MVQSLLDLLCSQLKNLLSQAGVSLLSAGKDEEDTKNEDTSDPEKKDFRGERFSTNSLMFFFIESVQKQSLYPLYRVSHRVPSASFCFGN